MSVRRGASAEAPRGNDRLCRVLTTGLQIGVTKDCTLDMAKLLKLSRDGHKLGPGDMKTLKDQFLLYIKDESCYLHNPLFPRLAEQMLRLGFDDATNNFIYSTYSLFLERDKIRKATKSTQEKEFTELVQRIRQTTGPITK